MCLHLKTPALREQFLFHVLRVGHVFESHPLLGHLLLDLENKTAKHSVQPELTTQIRPRNYQFAKQARVASVSNWWKSVGGLTRKFLFQHSLDICLTSLKTKG